MTRPFLPAQIALMSDLAAAVALERALAEAKAGDVCAHAILLRLPARLRRLRAAVRYRAETPR
jgi:hypothetical protein